MTALANKKHEGGERSETIIMCDQ